MPLTRAVIVLGMHRSGTSAVARGMAALGVDLGDCFLEVRPDNPTGYWEDKTIVALNERLLGLLALDWTTVSIIPATRWHEATVAALRAEAVRYLTDKFTGRPLWGFKDPRTIRLLPFWRAVLAELGVDDRYVVATRNPLSVASSLWRRQQMSETQAHLLWLIYTVPFLHEIAARPYAVIDYDLLLADPSTQLLRIAHALDIPVDQGVTEAITQFGADFLDPGLRHSEFSEDEYTTAERLGPLTREAYLWLRRLATDRLAADSQEFWKAWGRLATAVARLVEHTTVQR